MSWMDNLKVVFKMAVLGVIAVAGLLGVSIAGYLGLNTVRGDLNTMYESSVKGIDYVGSAMSGMRYAQGMVIIMTTCRDDPARLQELNQKYQAGAKQVDDAIAGYNAIDVDDEENDGLMENVESEWKNVHATFDQVAKLSLDGKYDEAIGLYSKTGAQQAAQMGKNLIALTQDEHQGAIDFKANTDQEVSAIIRNIVLIVLVVLVILIAACIFTTKKITEPLEKVNAACKKMQDGDFRDTGAAVTRGDEFGDMMRGFAEMRKTVRALMKKTNETVQQLAASSEELTASAHQSAQASDQVAQSVTNAAQASAEQQQYVAESQDSVAETLDSLNRLGSTADAVSEDAGTAYTRAVDGGKRVENAVADIESVEKVVNSSRDTVDKLGKSSQEIGTIVETISSIAEQTNLLALNAAIEAARAGEHGRGFAVVADEVRKLAEASQEAAQQITDLITGIQADTEAAVASMQSGSQAVQEGTAAVAQLKETFGEIRGAAESVANRAQTMVSELHQVGAQTGVVQEKTKNIAGNGGKVVNEMESVSAASEEQSASAGEIATASDSLAQLAQELSESLQKFKY